MRIGIITMPILSNYGGIMQAYALQTALRRAGFDPITLRKSATHVSPRIAASWIKTLVFRLAGKERPFSKFAPLKRLQTRGMQRFICKRMTVTREYSHITARTLRRHGIEGVCVGSDQIWRPEYVRPIWEYYCSAADGTTLPRIAYAASFGVGSWCYTAKETARCKPLAQQFRAITVRENSGVGLCEKHLEMPARRVLDPTMLLQRADYEALATDIPRQAPAVYAYVLDITPEKMAFFERLAAEKGLPLRVGKAEWELNNSDSPERWLAEFRDAAFVVTDSYHGSVFSILFHREFLALRNVRRGNERFSTLCDILPISDHFIDETHLEATPQLPAIDWEAVDAKLQRERAESVKVFEALRAK